MSFCSLTKEAAPTICWFCLVRINSVVLKLLCVSVTQKTKSFEWGGGGGGGRERRGELGRGDWVEGGEGGSFFPAEAPPNIYARALTICCFYSFNTRTFTKSVNNVRLMGTASVDRCAEMSNGIPATAEFGGTVPDSGTWSVCVPAGMAHYSTVRLCEFLQWIASFLFIYFFNLNMRILLLLLLFQSIYLLLFLFFFFIILSLFVLL